MALPSALKKAQWFFIGVIVTVTFTTLFSTSRMPIQNKVIRESLQEKAPTKVSDSNMKAVEASIEQVVDARISKVIEQLQMQSAHRPEKDYPVVGLLKQQDKKRILVTGGAGFVGSHLVDRLMKQGHEVIVVDNFFTGRKSNIEHWLGHPNFELVVHDVVNPLFREVDQIYHLACPASPPHYQYNPVKTIKTSVSGTMNMLGLATRVKARILFASTSEVYGDPEVHPQPESYWGHVNPIGPRACYDEGKRLGETLMYAYQKRNSVDVRVARIFNTYGPRMNVADGRVVSNFIVASLGGHALTVYGDGHQTRSFQYVDDLVDGLIKLMNSNYSLPVNIGNPEEYTIKDFAVMIRDMINPKGRIEFLPKTKDDPAKRRPDITTAKNYLAWSPRWAVADGLKNTIDYFRQELERTGEIARSVRGLARQVSLDHHEVAL